MKRREVLKTLGAAGVAGVLANLTQSRAASAQTGSRTAAPGSASTSDLQARLADAVARHKVVGASAAVFRDGNLETAAVGLANNVSGVEMTADTIMHIGSITKIFNATLVMQLADEGRLVLDAPLKQYLPDFRVADPDATERITVKMLLNHTSGIDGEITPDAGHDQERIVDGVARIAKMGQLFAPPGAHLSYSNAAHVLAGYLAQRLTGRSWYDLMKEQIYRPLGMDHAVVTPEDALLYRASVGHFLNRSEGRSVRTSHAHLPLSYSPCGISPMMSATDLVTFARAHLSDGLAPNGHRVLSESSARRMRTKTASSQDSPPNDYGLGWMLLPNGVVTHSGGGPGISSTLYAHPASQTVVVVLTNSAHGRAVTNEIASPILEEVAKLRPLGSDLAELVKQATDASVDPGPYVGQYESITTVTRVTAHGNGIAHQTRSKFKYYDSISLTDGPPVPLRPLGGARFALNDGVIGFVNPDTTGKMRHLASGSRLFKRVS